MINRCRRAPFLVSYQEFSIFVCRSSHWAPSEADLDAGSRFTARDVTTPKALFVADPFLAKGGDGWHLFFELMPRDTLRGVIGVAHSTDLRTWTFGGTVLEEPFHLSFPFVFQWNGDWFMMPECAEQGEVRLYRASSFPNDWVFERTLLRGRFADSVMWEKQGLWFLLSSPRMETVRLFNAPSPLGPWTEHPCSPIVENDLAASRPAGPVIVAGETTVRLAQDCQKTYGRAVFAFSIDELSATAFRERPWGTGPVLGPGRDRSRSHGMHHLHVVQTEDDSWVAACDGWRTRRTLGFPGGLAGKREIG